jgi:hypothetical protein
MKSFSQRMGLKPVKNIIQSDSMDDELRNKLWNLLDIYYWNECYKYRSSVTGYDSGYYFVGNYLNLKNAIINFYFNDRLDQFNDWSKLKNKIDSYFFSCEWNECYDFIEFIANRGPSSESNKSFIKTCNYLREGELSGYRFIDEKISPITSEEEIVEIEKALQSPISPVKEHLNVALGLF